MSKLVLIVALLVAATVSLAGANPRRLQKDILLDHSDSDHEETPRLSGLAKPAFRPETTRPQSNGLTKNKRRTYLDKMGRDIKNENPADSETNAISSYTKPGLLDIQDPSINKNPLTKDKRSSRIDECQAAGGICVRKNECLAGGENPTSGLCAGNFVCCHSPASCRNRGGSCESSCTTGGIVDANGKCDGNGKVCCVHLSN